MNCCDYDCRQGRDCPARSLNTRRYPRTLEQAFGPHTSREIVEPQPTGETPTWWVAMGVIAALTFVMVWVQR
jgi:hypothetical protein